MKAVMLLLGFIMFPVVCTPDVPPPQPPPPPPPPLQPPAEQVVVLDWTGGSRLAAANESVRLMNLPTLSDNLPPADLSQFDVWDVDNRRRGSEPVGTLADRSEFMEDVRFRVQEILGKLWPGNVVVVNGELKDYPGATIMWLSQVMQEEGILGRAVRDDCNLHSSDEGVIYMAAFVSESGFIEPSLRPPYLNWIQLVANATAHEAAHTLGFRHPPTMSQIPGFEIMRPASNTSMDDIRGFLVEYAAIPGQQPDMQCNAPAATGDQGATEYTFIGPLAAPVVIPEMRNIGWPPEFIGQDFEFLIDPFDPNAWRLADTVGEPFIFCGVGVGYDGSALE